MLISLIQKLNASLHLLKDAIIITLHFTSKQALRLEVFQTLLNLAHLHEHATKFSSLFEQTYTEHSWKKGIKAFAPRSNPKSSKKQKQMQITYPLIYTAHHHH